MTTETTALLGGALIMVALSTACSDNAAAPHDAGIDAGGDVTVDAAPDTAGDEPAPRAPSLTLSLDPTLDTDASTVKATSISSADLLDAMGATVAHAAIVPGSAMFALAGLTAGDYFIRVNGDDADLVPTRLDPAVDVWQHVGQKLRDGYIGSGSRALYRITTWTDSAVAGFSNDAPILGQHAYAVFTLDAWKVEIRVLGRATPLTSRTMVGGTHPGNDKPFDSWTINTPGQDHHGDAYNADGGPSSCSSCHSDYWRKRLVYADTTPTHGWCFACHDGPEGTSTGLVDPSK